MCKSSVNLHDTASHASADHGDDAEKTSVESRIESSQVREPTSEIYLDFALASRFFNAQLFEGKLPACIITLQRKQGAAGYFAANRFGRRERNEIYDEIALNPTHFAEKTSKSILSVLVHELCHLWQHHHGKPARGKYHNREWARKMIEVGLVPSDTGKEGGQQTGDRMSHYVLDGGPFDAACDQLLASGPIAPYVERKNPRAIVERDRKRASKTAYRCENCGMVLRGKPGLRVRCEECDVRLIQG